MKTQSMKLASALMAAVAVVGIAFSAPAEAKNNDQQKMLNQIAMQNYLNQQAGNGVAQNQYDLNISNLQKGGYLPGNTPNYNYNAYSQYGVNYHRHGHRRPYVANPQYNNGYNNGYNASYNNGNIGRSIINKLRGY